MVWQPQRMCPGHNVVLVDKQDEPGGEMRIAAVPPAKQELTRVIKYQYRRLAEAGVKCVFGTELTAEDIQRDYAGYEVVLAYGAEAVRRQKCLPDSKR